MRKRSRKRKVRGFTLIELLVVISIIGMISSVVMASLNNGRIRSRDAARVAQLKQVEIALALYFEDYKTYPGTGASTWYDMDCNGLDPAGGSGYTDFSNILNTPYINSAITAIGTRCLWYQRRNSGTGYRIMFQPEGTTVLDGDLDCFTPASWYCLGENW